MSNARAAAAWSAEVGPWLSTRVVAELPGKRANKLVAAVLAARGWDDLTKADRDLLEQARAEFEGTA